MSWGLLQTEKPSFESKVFYTDMIIQKAIRIFGNNLAVSWSGGKDSTFVLSRALKQKPNIKVIFCNTLVEFPETIRFVRKYTQEWKIADFIETHPIGDWTFRKVIDIKGLPLPRQTSKQGTNRVPFCCKVLKDDPAIEAIEKEGIDAILTGLTTAESETRGFLKRYDGKKYKNYAGCGSGEDYTGYSQFHYFVAEWNVWKFNPIMNWTETEVFEVHAKGNIPLNEVYTKWDGIYNRCGCLTCTAYLSCWIKLAKSHPLVYKWLLSYKKSGYTEEFSEEMQS